MNLSCTGLNANVNEQDHKRDDQSDVLFGSGGIFGSGGLLGGSGGSDGSRENGVFGQGSNLVSNVFDGAACIVSDIIGGGDPRCQGRGTATINVSANSGNSGNSGQDGDSGHDGDSGDEDSTSYTYTYDTDKDGKIHIVIRLGSGASCDYDVDADGKKVNDVVDDVAKKCVASH